MSELSLLAKLNVQNDPKEDDNKAVPGGWAHSLASKSVIYAKTNSPFLGL